MSVKHHPITIVRVLALMIAVPLAGLTGCASQQGTSQQETAAPATPVLTASRQNSAAVADETKVCTVGMLLKDDSCTYQYLVDGLFIRDGEQVVRWRTAVFSVRLGQARWENDSLTVVSSDYLDDDVCLGEHHHCNDAAFWAKPVEHDVWRIVAVPSTD